MRKCLIALLASVMILSQASAGDYKTYSEPEYKTPVIDESLDFEATREGHKVKLEWNTYKGDDFKYYKVMRSETHSNPVYPDQPALKYFPNADQNSHEFGNWSTKTAVYRVCVITTDKSRTCSNTVKLAGYVHKKKDYIKENTSICIQVIQPAYDKKTGKCKEFSTPCKVPTGWKKVSSCDQAPKMTEKKEYIKKEYVNKEKLDSRLQVRADQIVAKLIKRLEDKHGTDNEAKVKKLTDLTTKLNKINDRIKSEKTKALVTYLVEALEKKKAEYGTSDDIEEIFNILEE